MLFIPCIIYNIFTTLTSKMRKLVPRELTVTYHNEHCYMFRTAREFHQGIQQSNTAQNQISHLCGVKEPNG